MPAEWEPHEATWMAWPYNRTDWPGKFSAITWAYGEIVRKISTGELVRIIVNSKEHEAQARRLLQSVGVDMKRVQFFQFPTNRGWTRDFGPIFIKEDSKRPKIAIARFHFNGWAKYRDWKKDDAVPELVARSLGYPLLTPAVKGRFVLEGGSIDVNGRGALITTEECLLDRKIQPRNPHLSREQIEQVLCESLGVSTVLWLGRGIQGDDTHGHVDDACRFVGPGTVIAPKEENAKDYNCAVLSDNFERLKSMRVNGSRLEVVPIPMPEPLVFNGRRLPASYANFYVCNSAVLVPTFNDPNDRVAVGIISELISDRPVIGIHAVDLVWGFGTVHCLTQQQPALRRR